MTASDSVNPKRKTALKSWSLVLIIIILIPLAYSFFYFKARSAYLTNHYFRSLSGIENQINRGITGMDFLLGFALVDSNSGLSVAFKDKHCNKDLKEKNYCLKYEQYLKKYSPSFQNIKFNQKNNSCKRDSGKEYKFKDKNISDVTCFSIGGVFDNRKITVFDEKLSLKDRFKKKLKKEKEREKIKQDIGKIIVFLNEKKSIDSLLKEKRKELICAIEQLKSSIDRGASSESLDNLSNNIKEKLIDDEIENIIHKKIQEKIQEKKKELIVTFAHNDVSLGKISDKDIIDLINNESKTLTAEVPIKDLIDPIPALKYFNRILLLNQAGDIIYRSGADNISNTSNISAFDNFVRFENLDEYLHSGVTKELEIKGKTFGLKDVEQVTSHSRVRQATIAGIPYLLYIQPFHAVRKQNIGVSSRLNANKVKSTHKEPEKLAYIVGIIPVEKNNQEIISLPLGRINMLFFAILIIILLTPYLKLLFSGIRFMPSRIFSIWLAVAFPLLFVTLIIAALSAHDYFKLKKSFDNTAEDIAKNISVNFKYEFDHLNKVLRPKYFPKYMDCKDLPLEDKSKCNKNKNLPMFDSPNTLTKDGTDNIMLEQFFCELSRVEVNGIFLVNKYLYFYDINDTVLKEYPKYALYSYCSLINKPVLKEYPKFELAFYIDSKGSQSGRELTYREFPAIDINVHRRDYFKQPYYHSEKLLKWKGEEDLVYFAERIQTYDHGLKLTAFSFPVSSSVEKEPKVLAILKLMHTFFRHPSFFS